MSEQRGHYSGPQSHDVVWEHVGDGPVFGSSSESPVAYLPVENDNQTLGYVWYIDEPPAASFAVRRAARGVANNAAVAWRKALLALGDSGHAPSEAVSLLASGSGLGAYGRLNSRQAMTAPDVATLKASAAAEE